MTENPTDYVLDNMGWKDMNERYATKQMINPAELRIGNIITEDRDSERCPLVVLGIDDIFISVMRTGVVFETPGISVLGMNRKIVGNINAMTICAIELTEEWLLKFGFKKNNESGTNSIDGDYFQLNKFIIYINNNRFVLANIDIHVEIKHVHQLQNLYFALTGEELTL